MNCMRLTQFSNTSLLFVLLGVAACSSHKNEGDQKAEADISPSHLVVLSEEQFRNANILLGKVQERPISGTIKANGMLDVPPQNLVTISAPLGGFVKNTELLQGMRVQKGQVLVTLENPDYIQMQQDYLE